MKRYLLTLLTIAAISQTALGTPLGDFHNRVTAANLKPFALDIGGILGGAAFHSGRTLGFPGFDVGVVSTLQFRPDKNDTILRDSNVKAFGFPLLQAEVGLPLNFDVIVHGMSMAGTRVFGGGLRYGIHKSGLLSVLPDISISAFGDKVNQTHFSATHFSLNAAASFNLPVVHPYIGAGWDSTKVTVGSAAVPGLAGMSATANGTRFTAGVDISPLPFFHFYGAFTLLHGIPGADMGLGARF